MHGNTVAVYEVEGGLGGASRWKRTVLDNSLNQGHALAYADVLGTKQSPGHRGWRNKNKEGKVGIKLYAKHKDGSWTVHLIDDNKMACEDLKVADLNKDGNSTSSPAAAPPGMS